MGAAPNSFYALLVDDEPAILRVFSRFLARTGAVVITCRDGYEAIDRFREGPADIVLTDIKMPRMDGLALVLSLRELERQMERTPVPIVAITGSCDEAMKRKVESAGFSKVLYKPVDSITLVAAVQSLLADRSS